MTPGRNSSFSPKNDKTTSKAKSTYIKSKLKFDFYNLIFPIFGINEEWIWAASRKTISSPWWANSHCLCSLIWELNYSDSASTPYCQPCPPPPTLSWRVRCSSCSRSTSLPWLWSPDRAGLTSWSPSLNLWAVECTRDGPCCAQNHSDGIGCCTALLFPDIPWIGFLPFSLAADRRRPPGTQHQEVECFR